jgi:hypothetical protein
MSEMRSDGAPIPEARGGAGVPWPQIGAVPVPVCAWRGNRRERQREPARNTSKDLGDLSHPASRFPPQGEGSSFEAVTGCPTSDGKIRIPHCPIPGLDRRIPATGTSSLQRTSIRLWDTILRSSAHNPQRNSSSSSQLRQHFPIGN